MRILLKIFRILILILVVIPGLIINMIIWYMFTFIKKVLERGNEVLGKILAKIFYKNNMTHYTKSWVFIATLDIHFALDILFVKIWIDILRHIHNILIKSFLFLIGSKFKEIVKKKGIMKVTI